MKEASPAETSRSVEFASDLDSTASSDEIQETMQETHLAESTQSCPDEFASELYLEVIEVDPSQDLPLVKSGEGPDIAMANESEDHGPDVYPSPSSHRWPQPRKPQPSEPIKFMTADFYKRLRTTKSNLDFQPDEENSLLDQQTPQLNTPLHVVAREGLDKRVCQILEKRDSLLTQPNVNEELALHLAARAGHLAAVKCIAEFALNTQQGDVFKKKNSDGDTSLHLAVRHKHREVAEFLIDKCREASYCLNNKSESPLYVAAKLGELELVNAMIEDTVELDVQSPLRRGTSVLFAAISGGNLEVLEAILNKHSFLISSENCCRDGVPPLCYAASKGKLQIVCYMLTKCQDCNYKSDNNGKFPIHVAAAAGHKMVVEKFLQVHPDSWELLTSDGENILHQAAAHGKDDVVRYILSKPDLDDLINAKDYNGRTPLHHAVAAKYPKVVDALTWDSRVKLDLENGEGETAMDMALNFENSTPSFKEQLTWMALSYAGAPRKKFKQAKSSKKSERLNTNNYKDRVGTLSVVATLVVTISFAAGFTLPGGNKDSEPDPGMPNFLKRRIFQLFVISNSIALYTSVLDVLILIFAMLGDLKLLQVSLKFATPLLAISLATMSISFMSASYLVVSNLQWLGILIWVLGSIFLVAFSALFVLLAPPLSAKNWFTRYIVYVPFRAMLYICEGK